MQADEWENKRPVDSCRWTKVTRPLLLTVYVRACVCPLWSAVATSLLATSKTLVSSPVALEMKAFCWRSNEECACTYAHAPSLPLLSDGGKLKLTFKYAISVCGRRKCPRCTVKRSLSALFWGEGNPTRARGCSLSIRCNTHNAFLHSLRNDLEQPRERDSARHMGSAQYLGCARCAPVSLPACLPGASSKCLSTHTHGPTHASARAPSCSLQV